MVLLAFGSGEVARAQIALPKPALPFASKPAPADKQEATPPAASDQQAIPVVDIAVQAEAALSRIQEIENTGRIDDLVDRVIEELPLLEQEAAFRSREMRQLLAPNTQLETIRSLEEEWREVEKRASVLTRDLTRGALQLDRDVAELDALGARWEATSKAASQTGAPAEVLDRVRGVADAVAHARRRVLADRTKVLALQSKAAEVDARAAKARETLEDAGQRAVTRMVYRDSPPLWSAAFWQTPLNRTSEEAMESLRNQTSTLDDYLQAHAAKVAAHGIFFIGMLAFLSLVRSKVGQLCETDSQLQRSRRIYDMPVLIALLVTLLLSHWFYPRPPRSLWMVISGLGAVPVMVFGRRVIDSGLHPLFYAVVGTYLVDRLRGLFAPLPGISRLVLLAESLFMIGFILWVFQRSGRRTDAPQWVRLREWRPIRIGAYVSLFLVGIALLLNVGGYVRLADMIVRTVVSSAYAAAVLYALTRAGEGLLLGLLYLPPFSLLRMVKRNRMRVIQRINRWLKAIAFLAWAAMTLQTAGLMQPLIASVKALRRTSVTVGSLSATVGDMFSFVIILWASYQLSRLVRFILEEEVYPNVRLDRGLPYAVSTMLHYIILLTGMVLALGALGVDMTKFTIVAGALTVGIGFGLQNIVNNFVSGLIILFERPIKVGDTIQMDDIIGRVQRIGIRASIVQATTGAQVIIPNGKLISDKVINWTLSNRLRLISVPVVVKPDVDVTFLKQILLDIAHKDERVVENPPPEVLFVKRAIDTLEFELRVWTDDLDAWLSVKSDLITAINEALRSKAMAAQAPASSAPEPADTVDARSVEAAHLPGKAGGKQTGAGR